MAAACICSLRRGRVQQRNNVLSQDFYLRESCPLALALNPDNSVPPSKSLVPFKLFQHLSQSVSLHVDSLKGAPETLAPSSITQPQYPLVLQGLLFLSLKPWSGEPGVKLGPLAPPGGSFEAVTATCTCEDILFHVSTPS